MEVKSEEVLINATPETVFDKFSDPSGLRKVIDNAPVDAIPEDKRDLLNQIEVTDDGILLPAGPMGQMKLAFTERRRPELIQMAAQGSPVPMQMSLRLKPEGDNATKAQAVIEIEIPKMMSMMVKGPLTKMTNEIANMLRQIPFGANE